MPATAIDPAAIRITRLSAEPRPDAHLAALDAIFFEASATRSFPDEAARAAFRERWLGRYLAAFPQLAFIAVSPSGRCVGYVVGALDDPARDPRFSDIGYFRDLAEWTARYPAHLHINLAPEARGLGVGTRLVAAFAAAARARGAPGLHVVTAEGSRNRSFYARAGFALAATRQWNGHAIVLLAKPLR
jgi:GNAT superfamily N-acetyltransferase